MKYSKGIGCFIEIILFLLIIGIGNAIKDFGIQPLWIQIPLWILIGNIYKIKDWITPESRLETKLKKARKSRDKHKAINLFKEALSSEYISKDDKILVLEELAELYFDIGELDQSSYYYYKGIEHIQKELEQSFLPETERMQALGKIGFYYYNTKNYELAVNYLDRALDIGLYKPDFNPDADITLKIIKVYLSNDQQQKAIHIYNTLLQRKKFKKNKEVEEILGINKR